MHSRASSSVKPVMEACWCFGCRMEKGLLGARRRDKNAVIALTSPASCPFDFPPHQHRNKRDGGLRPWGAALRSATSSSEFPSTPALTGRLRCAETDESGGRSFGQGGRGGQRALHTLWTRSRSLDEKGRQQKYQQIQTQSQSGSVEEP